MKTEILLILVFVIYIIYRYNSSNFSGTIEKITKNLRIIEPNEEFYVYENYIADNTYTIDKKYIFICLKNKDFNTLMFVAIHELAHVKCKSYGHSYEFVKIFKEYLNKAISLGLYSYVDYSKAPVKYCNMQITSNII